MNKKSAIGSILIFVSIFISAGMFIISVDIISPLFLIPSFIGLAGVVIIYMEVKNKIVS